MGTDIGIFIKYNGVPLYVEGRYYRRFAGIYGSPEEPAEMHITDIEAGGVNIKDLLSEEQVNEIELLVIEEREGAVH